MREREPERPRADGGRLQAGGRRSPEAGRTAGPAPPGRQRRTGYYQRMNREDGSATANQPEAFSSSSGYEAPPEQAAPDSWREAQPDNQVRRPPDAVPSGRRRFGPDDTGRTFPADRPPGVEAPEEPGRLRFTPSDALNEGAGDLTRDKKRRGRQQARHDTGTGAAPEGGGGRLRFTKEEQRLKKLYGEIPPDRPQLRLLVNCAAASPDLAALKERTAVLTEAVNHLKTAELSMEQNYNMIDGIINNLPPDATMNDRANALIDFVEKDGQRLGDGERRLIVYYAEQVQDTGKLAALVDELAGTGYEQEHGQLNYLVKSRVEAEAAAADAQHQKDGPLPPEHDPAVQPVVTVIWSENAALHNGQKMPLAEADALFKQLDAVPREPGQYEKTSFRIDFTFNGALDSYEGRQDFGDGDGGLIDHIQSYREFYAKDEQWKDYVLRNDGPEALEKDTAQRETALTEFVPYLRLHCNLTQMERAADDVLAVVAKIEEPDGLDRTNAAYYGAVQAYVTECRGQLNTGAYQLPEAPKKEDFIDPEYQAYREQVREEVKQEAAAAGLTVEQYAANGYEPRSSSQPVQEPTGTPAMDAIEAKVQRGEAVSLMAMVDAAKSDRAAGRAGKKPSVHDTLEAAKKAPAKPRKPRTKKAPAKDGPERS